MKIQILSDLHIEFKCFEMIKTDADVVVLAGDIHSGTKGIIWAKENIKNCPVIYVLGNHEYYGKAYPKLINELKNTASKTNITILENDSIMIEEVLFLGCTLWTDFELFGSYNTSSSRAFQEMNDYKKIRLSPKYSKLKPLDTTIAHHKSVKWLKEFLFEQDASKKVIVTHHAPSFQSIPNKYKDDELSPAYASNLDHLIENIKVDLWIHGHVHETLNYNISSTKVICNPRGYPDELNNLFNPTLTIDL